MSADDEDPFGLLDGDAAEGGRPARAASPAALDAPFDLQIVDCAVFAESKRPDARTGAHDATGGDKGRVHAYIFGRTAQGESVTVEVDDHRPYFFIQLPSAWGGALFVRAFGKALNSVMGVDARVSLEWRSHAKGFRFDPATGERRTFAYAKTSFANLRQMSRVKRALAPTSQGLRRSGWDAMHTTAEIVAAMKDALGFAPPPIPTSDQEALTAQHTSCPLPQQLLAALGTTACGWLRVARSRRARASARFANTQFEVTAHVADLEPRDVATSAPLVIASFDIETMSGSGDFPDPRRPCDQVIQIGVSFALLGVPGIQRRVVLCLGATSEIETAPDEQPIEIVVFLTETALLSGFSQLLRETDPDIVMGYNILDFDWYYLCARVELMETLQPSSDAAQLMREAKRIASEHKFLKARNDNEQLPDAARERALEEACTLLGERFWDGCRFPTLPLVTTLLARMQPGDAKYFAGQKPPDFAHCGRLKSEAHRLEIQALQSAAMGDNVLKRFDMLGRASLDLFLHIKTMVSIKLSSYSLNSVCEKYLLDGQTKVDMPYSQLFDYYRSGDPRKRAEVARYCAVDCDLVCMLLEKLKIGSDLVEFSRATRCPLPALTSRGQGIKVFSAVVWEIEYACNMVLNTHDIPPPETYVGATVVNPTPGWYDEPIATLDFASLYPSIMRSNKLCPSNLILHDEVLHEVRSAGLRIREVEAGGTTWHFVQDAGIIPNLEAKLAVARKRRKKMMKEATTESERNVHNGAQMAIKVLMNSIYGGLGAKQGFFCCWPVAASTTSIGREYIEMTKAAVEEMYTKARGYKADAQVVYGDTDSVMVLFGGLPRGHEGVVEAWDLAVHAATYITDEVFKEQTEIILEPESASRPGCQPARLSSEHPLTRACMQRSTTRI